MVTKFDNPKQAEMLYEEGSIYLEMDSGDLALIVDGLKCLQVKLNRSIREIDRDPKNDGQATFVMKKQKKLQSIKYVQVMIDKLTFKPLQTCTK